MCRVYGKGSKRYIRLCYLTGFAGWRLYVPDENDTLISGKHVSSGHIQKYQVHSVANSRRLEKPKK